MAQFYYSDEIKFIFSLSADSDGRYRTQPIMVGNGRYGITVHNLPAGHEIQIEGNNSRPRLVGFEGFNNPVSYAIQNRQLQNSPISADPVFNLNWVAIKPMNEFFMDSTSANGCAGSDTGIFQVQGMFRFIRLSISAAPLTTGLTATRGYYMDESNILKG